MKALILTYYWPPSGGSGVQRWMYFAKYMRDFGIDPTIITVKESQASYSSYDISLVDEVKGIRTFKTSTLEPIRFYSFLKSGNSKKHIPQGNVGGKKAGILDQIAKKIRANYFIPDARIGWNNFAFKKAKELISREKFDFVITSGPPHSTHLIGLKLKKEFPTIKWIVDFRDPWQEVYYNALFSRTKMKEEKDRKYELDVLKKSDLVLTVGPSMKDLLQSKIPDYPFKVKYVFNGFDRQKIDAAEITINPIFTIAYIGTISSNYPYKSFLKALELLKLNSDFKIKLVLAGKIEKEVLFDFHQIQSDSLQVEYKGIIPHYEALSLMKSANLLFLCLPIYEGSSIFVSGKLLEYLASQKPILGILNPQSDAGFLINKYSKGKTFRENEIEEIQKYLLQIYSRFNSADASNDSSLLDFLERKNTAKELVSILKSSLNEKN